MSVWDEVKPGTVLVWRPTGSKVVRRVLVEQAPDLSYSGKEGISAYIRGVEINSRMSGLRARRGVRGLGETKPFFVMHYQVEQVSVPLPEKHAARVKELIEHLREIHARHAQRGY